MASFATNLDDEFRRVKDSFEAKASLTPEELKCFKITTLDDLKAIVSSIEKKQTQRKRLVYLKRIEPFVNTMIEFGKIVEVFLNVSDVLAFVWGPLKLLLTVWTSDSKKHEYSVLTAYQITQGFTNAFNSLLDIYQEISEQIPLLQSFKSLFTEHDHMKKLLVMIYEDILRFHLMALKYFCQRIWKELFASNWKGFTSDIDQIKQNLRRHKQLIESHASMSQFEEIRALGLREEKIAQGLNEDRVRRRKEAVFQWLSPPVMEITHERHIKARSSNPESCRWILDEPAFTRWFDPDYCLTPMLWLLGVPGAGKSVLSSFIIEQIKEKIKSQPNMSVAYFYFTYGDSEKDNFLVMARALLSQLLAQNEALVDCYDSIMAVSCAHGRLYSQAEAKKLLEIALNSRKTYVILDGLDECPRDQRKDICTWFRSIIDNLEKDRQDEIRCLFVSQEDGFAKKDLSMLPALKLTQKHNHADILALARRSQVRIEAKFGPCWLGKGQVELSDIVTARAKGMFIFARCVLEELEQCASKADLENEWSAESFPEEMDQVYDRIYQRLIEKSISSRRKLTQRLLSWICQAKRPLRWFEIQAAISLDLSRVSINDKDRRVYNDCKDICASLVEVLEDQTVELVHSTTRDFLIKHNIVKPSHAELDLCLMTVAYLSFPEFSLPRSQDEIRRALLDGRYAFYEYSVACWSLHLISGALDESSRDEEARKRIEHLYETLERFLAAHHTGCNPQARVPKRIHDKLVPFKDSDYYDSLTDAVIWTRKQISVNETSGSDGSSLDFPEITDTIRSEIETLISTDQQADAGVNLKLFYGESLFKCPKAFCQHFFKGFKSKDARDRHLDRHERAYVCTFEGCYVSTFGCVSQKELENHMLQSHGVTQQAADFPEVLDPDISPRGQAHNDFGRYKCTHCPKRFGWPYDLKSHLRTHTNERPYVCTICGKSFGRNNDKKRHERLHSEERFICGGTINEESKGKLGVGEQWGCGRQFSRSDLLMSHFRSATGRLCIDPVLVEQENLPESFRWLSRRLGESFLADEPK